MFSQPFRMLCLAAILCLTACGTRRAPVPPGVIPEQTVLYSEDEVYGHEVLNNLTQQYPLDRDDGRINRVRDIVDRLTRAANADKNPWNSYVLMDDNFKNAAATRGNYIFVWTGMLKSTKSDAELATILAHEIGHVLAGHTASDPAEETNRIIAGIAGAATGGVVGNYGLNGPVSDLAELIVRASLEALLVNPDSQAKEYEADQIGLFIMSDAAYDPDEAIAFWTRIQDDPDFRSSPIEFLSSHPNTKDRLAKLQALQSAAKERYEAAKSGRPRPPPPLINTKSQEQKSAEANFLPPEQLPTASDKSQGNEKYSEDYWRVMERSVDVFAKADKNSALKQTLKSGDKVKVVALRGRWLEINEPVSGFVQSKFLAPLE